MTKAAARALYIEKRKHLATKEIADAFTLFNNSLLKLLKNRTINVVGTYCPILKFNEIDALQLALNVKGKKSDITICVPKINVNNTLDFFKIDNNTTFAINKWGIKEPLANNPIEPNTINALIIPLLSFTTKGYRVGYGKGFYDKFLATCNSNILKIGLCYFNPIDIIDDIEPHDKVLTHCITPNTVYEF